MRRTHKLALTAVMAGAAFFAMAAQASASSISTPGGGAFAYYDPNRNMFGLQDSKADGNSVFIEYWVNNQKQPRIVNYNGNGSWRDYYIGGDGLPLRWKLCVDIRWSQDVCSGTLWETV
ncbi:hypothetical protein [Streptomyces sp. NRRL F-4474]|uniref:hypothetical protein n=1 Tax=Streptomyces sp. NRRL F-4474 TaxID=1463851 RepID=UPI0004CC6AA3|nr:hypothetical protein [Streptomyces sp. NRRL F-4474]